MATTRRSAAQKPPRQLSHVEIRALPAEAFRLRLAQHNLVTTGSKDTLSKRLQDSLNLAPERPATSRTRGRTQRSQKYANAPRSRRSTESSSGRAGLAYPHLHAGRPCSIGPRPLRLARSPATPPARMTNPPATSPATRLLAHGIGTAVTHCRAIPSPASTPRTNITAAAHQAHPHWSPVRASAQSPATLPPTPMMLRIGSTVGGAAAGVRAASATPSCPRTSVAATTSHPRVSAIAAPTGTEELPGCQRQPEDPDLPSSPGQPAPALVCYAGYSGVSTLQTCLLPYRHQQSFSNRHYSGPP